MLSIQLKSRNDDSQFHSQNRFSKYKSKTHPTPEIPPKGTKRRHERCTLGSKTKTSQNTVDDGDGWSCNYRRCFNGSPKTRLVILSQ